MLFPSRPPDKLSPRPDFKPEDFRKLMFHRGMDMIWEQAQECPCRRKSSDFAGSKFGTGAVVGPHLEGTTTEARPDCEMCEGTGYFHHTPQTIKGLVTRASSTPEAYAAWGEYARGMIYLTFLPEHIPGLFDRMTMEDSAMVFRESRVRSAAATEKLRYPIVARQLDLQSGLASVDVLQLQKSADTGLTVPADELMPGVDFAVTGGELDFSIGGSPPLEGTRYSISYYAKPRYVVIDHPHTHRDTFVKVKAPEIAFAPMPVQCMARLDFLGESTS
jgi:hypothetical protein